jgi:hypothetical protein
MALSFLATGLGLAAGCEAEQQLPSKPNATHPPAPSPTAASRCSEGATKDCHVTVGEEAGILTCLVGASTCTNGTWGPCEGTISSKPAPQPPEPRDPAEANAGADLPKALSLSNPTACTNDPCDPTCQIFDEVPDGGVKPPLSDGGSYQGGSVNSIPGGFAAKGLKEPCDEAFDCQFDHYCSAPASGSCAHSKCATGAALASSCDPCVTSICAQTPSCCTSGWDASCVSKVASVCGAVCGGAIAGDCKPWAPGATDPACAGADLTIGVPCSDTVPVCNRGQSAAPAGVKVHVYPGNSSHFPKCAPPAGSESAECTLSEAIPPGGCVQLTDADCEGNNTLNGNKTLMVNPTAAVAECHCQNNWSDYHNGGCQTSTASGYSPITYKQLYQANCPAGTKTHWSYLSYGSTTPGNASIAFEAHTGTSAASLSPTLTLLATAKASPAPDTQQCPFTGVSGCPISLYTALGHTSASQSVLELVITLNPTSDKASAPTLDSWKVTYSCPDAE